MTETSYGYTKEQLIAAFDKVKNKEHWKNPIDSFCNSNDVAVTYAAIEYFTGTEAKFDYLGLVDGNHMLKVYADGYRLGPCGDH